MRTVAQKQNQPQKQVSSSFARSNTAILGTNHHANPLLHLQRTIGNQAVQRVVQTNAENLDGHRLIAHELTHVVQQSKGSRNKQHISRQPKKGKVVRVEHAGKFSRRPPGPGAYTQAELNSWYERHPKATSAGGANLVDGERTKDKAYTPEELWKRGYYYAKTSASEEWQQAWESWLNDKGDGKVITVSVRYDK